MRGSGLSIVRNPSPGSHLTMRSDLSHRGRGDTGSICFALRNVKQRNSVIASSNGLQTFTQEYDFAFSRRDASEVCEKIPSLRSEGAGNAGRPMRPQPGRAEKTSHASSNSHHGHTGNHPAFPAQWFYGFLRALPGDRALLPPSPADHFRQLDTSVGVSGPHDFAVRAQRHSSLAPHASTASRPASVTIAKRPSESDGTEMR